MEEGGTGLTDIIPCPTVWVLQLSKSVHSAHLFDLYTTPILLLMHLSLMY